MKISALKASLPAGDRTRARSRLSNGSPRDGVPVKPDSISAGPVQPQKNNMRCSVSGSAERVFRAPGGVLGLPEPVPGSLEPVLGPRNDPRRGGDESRLADKLSL